MRPERFHEITGRYPSLHIAVAGDFCLDRYLEIDAAKEEISLETGLPVHNVVRVRAQPGGAGTILNNLAALGVGEAHPVGFCGEDAEGYELRRALAALPGVRLDSFFQTAQRRTFTYCKPLVIGAGLSPRELNRLDSKNWTPTPKSLQRAIAGQVSELGRSVDAMVLLEQTDEPETGAVTPLVRNAACRALRERPRLLVLADSRRGLGEYPPLAFKMNGAELAALTGRQAPLDLEGTRAEAAALARRNGQPVFVTLAERGIVGATPDGSVAHVEAFPVRGPIDVVGAGDAVTANLAAALAAGATACEAMELAMAAASVVVHRLGDTGAASVAEVGSLVVAR
ncbi:MAG: PfkB family carbohydrate kinase [Verrucomicrobiota bacterium]|nr:PfkB family carbohydrate kinase [Verrucomicrobiota bacterium]